MPSVTVYITVGMSPLFTNVFMIWIGILFVSWFKKTDQLLWPNSIDFFLGVCRSRIWNDLRSSLKAKMLNDNTPQPFIPHSQTIKPKQKHMQSNHRKNACAIPHSDSYASKVSPVRRQHDFMSNYNCNLYISFCACHLCNSLRFLGSSEMLKLQVGSVADWHTVPIFGGALFSFMHLVIHITHMPLISHNNTSPSFIARISTWPPTLPITPIYIPSGLSILQNNIMAIGFRPVSITAVSKKRIDA